MFISDINLGMLLKQPTATVIGWGIPYPYNTKNIQYSRVLKEIELKLISLPKCQKYYENYGIEIYTNQICAVPFENSGNVALVSIFENF